jgi:large subunit ribosomal protein L9
MKVILLKSVSKLGRAGEIKEVSDGYGRNYLLPQNLAKETDKAVVYKVQAKIASQKRLAQKQTAEIDKFIKQFSDLQLEFKRKTNELGHLFAQVKEEEIKEELKRLNFLSLIKKVEIPVIKATGEFFCQVYFQNGQSAKIKIVINPF